MVEGHHLKNNRGDSHSRKKRAAPVDAWSESNPSRGGHHVKIREEIVYPKALHVGAAAVDCLCLDLRNRTLPEGEILPSVKTKWR